MLDRTQERDRRSARRRRRHGHASLQNKHLAGFQHKQLQLLHEGELARSGRRSTHSGLDADARRRIAQPIRAGLELQLDPALD